MGGDLHFMIDGVADGVGSGTVYQIEFVWTEETRNVSWHAVESMDSEALELLADESEHRYYLAGTFLRRGELQEMQLDEDGIFEASFRIGTRSKEEFYIVCNRDQKRLL